MLENMKLFKEITQIGTMQQNGKITLNIFQLLVYLHHLNYNMIKITINI